MPRFMIFIHSVTIESSWNHFQSRTWHLVVRGSYSDARKEEDRGRLGGWRDFEEPWEITHPLFIGTQASEYTAGRHPSKCWHTQVGIDPETGTQATQTGTQASRQIYTGRERQWTWRPQASFLKAIFMLNHTKVGAGAGVMAQRLRAPAALLENLVLVPSTYPHGSSQLSSSRDLTPSSGSQGH